MKNMPMCELRQKGLRVHASRKLQYFLILCKVFKNEENHHIFTPGQLKHKNSLNWMKNVHMCELRQKIPQVHGGRKLQFFWFFEKFSKMKKIIIFPSRTSKIKKKITHLDEKCAHVWIEPIRSHGPQWAKTSIFFLFFEKFLKMKKIIIFSLQDN